jgi:hypothetical protein
VPRRLRGHAARSLGLDAVTRRGVVLDEPSTLPEGTEIDLIPADDIDELDPAERARLHGFLADSIRKHVPGTGVPAGEVLARLRARH